MSTSYAEPVLAWYARNARDLPWRAPDATPWAVLVSEIMLQQTPVARVLPEYLSWMARWPTPAALAASPTGEAIRQWGRLGYPRRALRLHETATILVAQHGGKVPADLDALRALPGIGSYTAAAVASFAFGQRQAVLDTNVRRVLARLVAGRPWPGTASSASVAERRLAESLLPADVGVEDRVALPEGEARDRRRGVGAHAGQGQQFVKRVRDHAAVPLRDRLGRGVQPQRAPRVAQAPPLPDRVRRGSRRERRRRRPPLQPRRIGGKDPGHRRLLQHDLADQHRPRASVRPAPGQIARMGRIPAQDRRSPPVHHDTADCGTARDAPAGAH